MTSWLSAVARTWLPRVLASVLGGVATYVGVKTSGAVQIDPAAAAEGITTILLTYSAAHKAVSSVINPGDAAKGRVAKAEKAASSQGGTVVVPRS